MRKIIATLGFLSTLAGCSREYECTNDTLKLTFIGYTKADVDTLVIRRYAINDNFQRVEDSVQIFLDTMGVIQSHDTITFGGNKPNNIITYGSGWQVYIPSKNKTISISYIVSPQQQGKCGTGYFSKVACVCYNNIESLVQDGQLIYYPARDTSFSGYRVYIRN
jgi:hypothetical protein